LHENSSSMEKVFASIITIGDELLIGQVIDTNSAWIAQELNKNGITLKHRIAVGDVWDDIWSALDEESRHASLIIITGGLGPTADDITKPLLCEYFGGKMVVHQPTLEHVTRIFNRLNRPMIDRNTKQAEVPDVCTVLKNDRGTAPGMMFQKNGTIFISLPGVPHEMKWIMENQFIPLIPELFKTGFIEHRTLLTYGIGESFLADLVKDLEESLPAHIKLAYLPNYGIVRMRLTAFGFDQEALQKQIGTLFLAFKEKVKEFLVVDEDISMELFIARLLKEKNETLSTAESCTGGNIARLITANTGSSAYYKGTVVSYANEVKKNVLHVKEETLRAAGAVSEETVQEMARSVRLIMQTDYSIAVSGIMGPGGGSEAKPVGFVWVAVANKDRVMTKQFQFRYDRARNIEMTSYNALNLLRIFINENR
jgi:nicotinamide-nucleotide amidase